MSAEVAMMTRAGPWRKLRSVNETSNGYVSKIPRATSPFTAAGLNGDAGTATGASVIQLTNGVIGGQAQSGAEFLFYGVGANNTTFSARIIGWSALTTSGLSPVNPETQVWIPVVLVEVQCTLSSTPIGLAGRAIVATELFADTITLVGTTGVAGLDMSITSPANDTIARVFVDLWGHTELEVQFTTGGSATSCNGLFRLF